MKNMNELVTLNQNEKPITTSLLVAKEFNKRHDHVLEDVRKLITDCNKAEISLPWFREREYKTRGKEYPYYEMNRKFFVLLVMGFSGSKALRMKSKYIDCFDAMERKLVNIALERQTEDWNVTRIDGKMQRRKLTDILAPFKIYALEQGSKGTAANTFGNFTQIVNKAAGINAGERDLLTDDMLRRVAHLEGIVEMKVKSLMDQGMYCKKIYQECKDMLDAFVDLVPYTGVMYLPTTEKIIILEVEKD